MANDLLLYLARRIDEDIARHSQNVSDGRCEDFGDYKHKVGIIRGYRLAKDIIAETNEKLEKDEFEE